MKRRRRFAPYVAGLLLVAGSSPAPAPTRFDTGGSAPSVAMASSGMWRTSRRTSTIDTVDGQGIRQHPDRRRTSGRSATADRSQIDLASPPPATASASRGRRSSRSERRADRREPVLVLRGLRPSQVWRLRTAWRSARVRWAISSWCTATHARARAVDQRRTWRRSPAGGTRSRRTPMVSSTSNPCGSTGRPEDHRADPAVDLRGSAARFTTTCSARSRSAHSDGSVRQPGRKAAHHRAR